MFLRLVIALLVTSSLAEPNRGLEDFKSIDTTQKGGQGQQQSGFPAGFIPAPVKPSFFSVKPLTTSNPLPGNITYHGGKLLATPNIYVLFYGTWTAAEQGLIQVFLSTVGSSTWYNVQKKYYQKVGTSTTYVGAPVWKKAVVDSTYSQGKALSSGLVFQAILNQGKKGAFPVDPTAIYFVFSSSDVTEASNGKTFCGSYCGYHSYVSYPTYNLTFSFVGNPSKCTGCMPNNQLASPNALPAVDAMLATVAHELVETQSNPFFDGWYDANNNENADKCAWVYGTVSNAVGNTSQSNVQIGGNKYLLHQNWNVATQACAISA